MVRKVNLHVLLSDVKVKRLDFLTTMGCRPQESSPPSCQGSRCTIECALPVPRVWQESYGDRLNALSLHGRGGLETETGAINLALANGGYSRLQNHDPFWHWARHHNLAVFEQRRQMIDIQTSRCSGVPTI